jgi:hypothetical protein
MTHTTAHDRLYAAMNAVNEGRFEEALREFVWFHDHALEEQPSLAGLRLSYALAFWMSLAEVYPEARQALEEIRDRKAGFLSNGNAKRAFFHDVAAINEKLNSETDTYLLFAKLAQSNPSFAQQCADAALPALIGAGDFALAERFLPDLDRELDSLSRHLNGSLQRRKGSKYSPAPRIKAEIHIYATRVKQLVAVLSGCGRRADAARIKALACAMIQAPSVRRAVREALEPNPKAWYERGSRPKKRARPTVN